MGISDSAATALDFAIDSGYNPPQSAACRCRNDAWVIKRMLNAGAEGVTIANIGTADEAARLVEAVYYPPKGHREFERPQQPARGEDYFEWAASEIIVGCQIEGEDGLRNYRQVVRVDGIDYVLS